MWIASSQYIWVSYCLIFDDAVSCMHSTSSNLEMQGASPRLECGWSKCSAHTCFEKRQPWPWQLSSSLPMHPNCEVICPQSQLLQLPTLGSFDDGDEFELLKWRRTASALFHKGMTCSPSKSLHNTESSIREIRLRRRWAISERESWITFSRMMRDLLSSVAFTKESFANLTLRKAGCGCWTCCN